MPFCPQCKAEYTADRTHCSEDNSPLVDSLTADDTTTSDLVDVFACYDGQQIVRATEVLHNASIDALVRDRTSMSFPTPGVGGENRRTLAVAQKDAGTARDVLASAAEDEVIGAEGLIQPSA